MGCCIFSEAMARVEMRQESWTLTDFSADVYGILSRLV